jgi:hypothetical protein
MRIFKSHSPFSDNLESGAHDSTDHISKWQRRKESEERRRKRRGEGPVAEGRRGLGAEFQDFKSEI